MAKRKGIGKKLRFEVLKRDSFTCQYCGAKAPDVLLHVDHVNPVAKGGKNDLVNLVAACVGCNQGKGDRELGDDTALKKQQAQLASLQDRREQIEMMVEWQKSLTLLDDAAVDGASDIWDDLMGGWTFSDFGRAELKRRIRKHGLQDVVTAMREAAGDLVFDAAGTPTRESALAAWNRAGKIVRFAKLNAEKPYLKELFYIRGIIRNRYNYCDQPRALAMLEQAYLKGTSLETLRDIALEQDCWDGWCDVMTAPVEGTG